MKKLILFSLMMFSGLFLGQNIAQDSGGDGDGLEEPCEESINHDGPLIVVTVCNLRTSNFGLVFGVRCNKESDTSCEFTNGPA
ncbi:hypothetical protein MM213_15545 [Belliella sp. R4-6]|uniref:Uncharacterized protein n=1 Tax=Belliella alkalica TaxID=1730871 RepID=A0ABS9VEP7_9BACT|nr:hypothetical protein [Belliella alkalica]MCH7414914.1 hypothetical protein [Belliella alkalica]